MIQRLAKCYGRSMSAGDSARIATAIDGAARTFCTGVKTAGWYFSLTGVGAVPVAAMNASLNAALTYTAGQSIAAIFSRSDFDPTDLVPTVVRDLLKVLPTKTPAFGKAVAI